MNAYYIQDRLEAQSWARHYQQIAREEKEAELADDLEKGLAWTLSRTMNPAHAGFTARTVIIRSALPSGWMNAAANHSKPAKAEKSRGRGSRIPNGCYGIKP